MKYNQLILGLVSAVLLLFAIGCDLNVVNINQPETARVLALPEDIESLVWGSYNTYWNLTDNYLGLRPILSATSFEHSAFPANFGMVHYSWIPRRVVDNSPAHDFASYLERTWYHSYRAIVAASDAIKALENVTLPASGDLTSEQRMARAEAFGRFVQGVSHGMLAQVYDQAVVFDESKDAAQPQGLLPYAEVHQAALDYLQEAIDIATNNTFTIPSVWTAGNALNNTALAKLAKQYRAYYRANLPRTPGEATAVNWTQVSQDIDAAPINVVMVGGPGDPWHTYGMAYINFFGWSQIANNLRGMSDQSGAYQTWMGKPWGERTPFLFITPDKRFPQGDSVAAQQANPGLYMLVPANPGGAWARPERGTYRWSYYRDFRYDGWLVAYSGPMPHLTARYMLLLKAEALYRSGDAGGAATIINETRVANGGLNATDAAGTNTDAVPKGLAAWTGFDANGVGNLLEMLKWEFRLETYHHGFSANYFNSRRWGDLMEGTFLHLPVPGSELEVLQLPRYTTGGVGGDGGALIGTYGY